MKRLTLLRHAKSGFGDRDQRDFDRVLNARGERAAVAIGRALKAEGALFDRVIASDAARVAGTIALVERGLGAPLDPIWERRVYLASAATLLEIVQAQPDTADHVLLAGHNPGLEDLVLILVPERADDALRAAVYEKLPTGSRVELEFDVDDWAAADTARITRFSRPRDLDPELGPDEDTD